MVIFENNKIKIEIGDYISFCALTIKSDKINIEIEIGIEKIYVSENELGNRIVRISGQRGALKIVFSRHSVIFLKGFLSVEIELSEEEKKQIQEKLEEFCRDFWMENENGN